MNIEQKKIRAFIAIEISKDIRNELTGVGNLLWDLKKNDTVKMSVVKPENIHITLQFLGDISCSIIDDIGDEIAHNVKDLNRFTLTIEAIGGFPNLNRPKVIWAGVNPSTELSELRQKVILSTAGLPIKPTTDKFNPHLTLARVKNCPAKLLRNALNRELARTFGILEVNGFSLMQSELTDKGALYTEICRWNLK